MNTKPQRMCCNHWLLLLFERRFSRRVAFALPGFLQVIPINTTGYTFTYLLQHMDQLMIAISIRTFLHSSDQFSNMPHLASPTRTI